MSLISLLLALLLTAFSDGTDEAACRASETARALDFWIGEWTVTVEDAGEIGRNRIERVLKGCAVIEHWVSSRGAAGKSLFFYDARSDRWEQVWVTEDTARPFGLKRKGLVKSYKGPGVRFKGRLEIDGAELLDRTTLVPLENGQVRQIIEYSKDAGATWQTSFDALYVPAE